jgi:hypothetical protein
LNKHIILTTLLVCISLTNYGQIHIADKKPREHHEHHKNEIGIANSPVYFTKEKGFAYGLHLHYVRNIPKTRFGLGFGYERILDEHQHTTFGLVGTYRPIEKVSFNVSPGVTFEKASKSAIFALHLETAYEWEIRNFHIGPAFEFAYDPEDFHTSLGLHIGYGF